MNITPTEAIEGKRWTCLGHYVPGNFDGNAVKMFQNVPAGTTAAKITVRGSALDYACTSIGYGVDAGNTIAQNESRTFEGTKESLESIWCAGDPGVTTVYIEYYGAK